MPFLSIIGLFFGGLFKKALAVAAKIPPKVWIAIGIIVALLFAWHIHTGWEKATWNAGYNADFKVQWARYQAEIAKERTDRAAIDQLVAQIGKQNAAIDALNADSNARMKAGADALAAAKQGRAATESAVAALQASAARNIAPGAPCATSEAVKAIGKDL